MIRGGQVYDASDLKKLNEFIYMRTVSFSPEGDRLFYTSLERESKLTGWYSNLSQYRSLSVLHIPTGHVHTVLHGGSNGHLLAVGWMNEQVLSYSRTRYTLENLELKYATTLETLDLRTPLPPPPSYPSLTQLRETITRTIATDGTGWVQAFAQLQTALSVPESVNWSDLDIIGEDSQAYIHISPVYPMGGVSARVIEFGANVVRDGEGSRRIVIAQSWVNNGGDTLPTRVETKELAAISGKGEAFYYGVLEDAGRSYLISLNKELNTEKSSERFNQMQISLSTYQLAPEDPANFWQPVDLLPVGKHGEWIIAGATGTPGKSVIYADTASDYHEGHYGGGFDLSTFNTKARLTLKLQNNKLQLTP